MKLKSIETEANLINEPTASDLDAASRLGPTINKHLTSLEALCKLIPDCSSMIGKLKDLRTEFSNKIQLQGNVLESPGQNTQQMQNQGGKSVEDLENKLQDMAKGTGQIDYPTIDREMKKISQQNSIKPEDLHKEFVKNKGKSPDAYAQDVRSHRINEEIAALFDELSETLGESVWIAITKRLTNQGYDKTEIKESVNKAIVRMLS